MPLAVGEVETRHDERLATGDAGSLCRARKTGMQTGVDARKLITRPVPLAAMNRAVSPHAGAPPTSLRPRCWPQRVERAPVF